MFIRTISSFLLFGLAIVQAQTPALTSLAALPLQFEPNQGQTGPQVQYVSRGPGYTVLLANREAILRFKGVDRDLRLSLVGAAASPATGEMPLVGKTSYFIGNDPSRWRTGIPTFGQVRYKQVYPGIDLLYYGSQSQLEYDFVVAPGARTESIRLRFQGMGNPKLEASGDLSLGVESLSWHKPVAYQTINSQRREVRASYKVAPDNTVAFTVGPYDHSQPLVIDPTLVYATLAGGTFGENANAIRLDGSGNIYITGGTGSIDFPGDSSYGGGVSDVYILKLNPTATAILASGYGGGSDADTGFALALDSSNNIYVAGDTSSDDFPTTVGAAQTSIGSSHVSDGFTLKLSAAFDALLYGTYHGGTGLDFARGIALDPSDNSVYVVGQTSSTNFPTISPLQGTLSGFSDGYVLKLNSTASARTFSTYLGGSAVETFFSVAVDATGVYVAGSSTSTDYPNDGVIQAAYAGGNAAGGDCVVTKFTLTGSARLYSTYLGGPEAERCFALAIDPTGAAYVTGHAGAGFPLVNPIQTYAGGGDAFVTKINPAGNAIVYSTYIGSANYDVGSSIAVDSSGNAYVTGSTNGTLAAVNAVQPVKSGGAHTMLKSVDGGVTWNPSDTNLGGTFPVNAVAIDPVTPATLYAGGTGTFVTSEPISKSTDSGATWSASSSGITQQVTGVTSSGTVQAIAISQSTPATLYAALNLNLFRSTDSGATWTAMAGGLPSFDKNFQAVAIDPTNANIVYAGLNGSGVYKTTDGGTTWTAMNTGLTGVAARDIAINPTTPQTIYFGTNGAGIFKSTNGGTSWTGSGSGLTNNNVIDLEIAPSNPTILYAVGGGVVNKSTNSGANWARFNTGIFGIVNRVTVDPTNPNTAYAATVENGIFKTTDGGTTWNAVGAGYGDNTVRQIAVVSGTPATMYAAMGVSSDIFVAKLNPAGSAFTYLTYLGGRNADSGSAIAFDVSGNAYIAGTTFSNTFPETPGGIHTVLHGGSDLYVAKISDATAACTYALVTDNSTFRDALSGQGAGNVRVTAPSGCAWTAVANDSWLSIRQGASGTGVGVVTYGVAGSTGTNRTGTLTIAGQTVTINQSGSGCTFSLNLTSQFFPDSGGNQNVTLTATSGCPWSVVNPLDWVTFNTPLTGGGNAILNYTVAPATSDLTRSGNITIGGIAHTVNEAGHCFYGLTPFAAQVFGSGATTGSVSVTAGGGCAWGTSTPTSFITITSGASGSSDGTINFSLSANPDATTRFGSFAVAGNTVNITQNGTGCSFVLNTSSVNVPLSGAAGNFTVTTSGGCARNAVSSDTWLTITSGATGSGNGTINYSAAANAGPGRSATITGIGNQTFTVNQAAGSVILSSIAPPRGPRGRSFPVLLSGSNFVAGSAVSTSLTTNLFATGPTVVVNSGQINSNFTIAGKAPIGPVNVSVTSSTPIPFTIGDQDFNSDGYPDLIWREDNTRQVVVHNYAGTGGAIYQSWGWLNSSGVSGWRVVATADFNGDGVRDLVWQNDSTRQVVVNYYGGTGGTVYQGFNWLDVNGVPGWSIVAAADFNGDGVPDLVWQNDSTRQIVVFYYGGAGGAVFQGFNWLNTTGVPGWSVKAAADFNRDGVPDLIWQNDISGAIVVYYFGGTGGAVYQGFNWLNTTGVPGWHVTAAADLDGNGVPDLIWQNDATRQVVVHYYGGTGGAVYQGFNWLNTAGVPGWSVII